MQLNYDERTVIRGALAIEKQTPIVKRLLSRNQTESLKLDNPEEKNCIVSALKYYLIKIEEQKDQYPRYAKNRSETIDILLKRLEIHFSWDEE